VPGFIIVEVVIAEGRVRPQKPLLFLPGSGPVLIGIDKAVIALAHEFVGNVGFGVKSCNNTFISSTCI
jgi:hypothetical protein